MDQSACGVLKKNSKNFQPDFKIYVPQPRKFLAAPNKRTDLKMEASVVAQKSLAAGARRTKEFMLDRFEEQGE
jgi:hypothetical protein